MIKNEDPKRPEKLLDAFRDAVVHLEAEKPEAALVGATCVLLRELARLVKDDAHKRKIYNHLGLATFRAWVACQDPKLQKDYELAAGDFFRWLDTFVETGKPRPEL